MSEPVFSVCALQIFQRAISGERHLGCLKFGLWSLMFFEVGKALSKCIPDLVLDCIQRDSPIDQDDASRFVFGQLSIGANHALVGFIRLFLHSIANYPFAAPQCRLDFLTHELAVARFRKEQFSFRRRGMIVFRMLEQMLNAFANRGAAGLPKNYWPEPPFFQTGGEPFHLRRFSAALGTFECDQRHGHDFAAKGSHCRTPHFRLVRLASEGEV